MRPTHRMHRALSLLLVAAGFCLLAGRPAAASEIELENFLREVEAESWPASPVRADGEITITSPEKTVRDQLVLVQRETRDLYIELRKLGVKALLLNGGEKAFTVNDGAKPAPFAAEAALAGSDFTREDLQPFRAALFQTPRIADESPLQMTVTAVPRASQYSLIVVTIDREKKTPIKTLYYQETLNNLVKMRRDEDHILVGRRWLPGKISMEHFQLRTRTTLHLRYDQNPTIRPEWFQPDDLARPSEIAWPEAPK